MAYEQQWAFTQNGQVVGQADASQPAESTARRVKDFVAFSAHIWGDATAKGSLALRISNAPVAADALVAPAQWTPIAGLTLDVGGKDTLPALLTYGLNGSGWVELLWTPAGGSSGALGAFFEGVRAR